MVDNYIYNIQIFIYIVSFKFSICLFKFHLRDLYSQCVYVEKTLTVTESTYVKRQVLKTPTSASWKGTFLLHHVHHYNINNQW